ncbi:TNT domain-containing protein, partial [Pantoea stewartii]|uniref:TNT domain-containing protein n=1 Tax=Pantoea stewartii TaxID=66269 RepID=UPI0019399C23
LNPGHLHTAILLAPGNGMDYLFPLRLTEHNSSSRSGTMNIVFMRIDLAKNVFQLCGLNHMRRMRWDGWIRGAWPPNRGFVISVKETLQPGTKLDRYGGWTENGVIRNTGTFLSPAGASFEGRALPDYTLKKPLSTCEVLKSYEVDAGPAIPWFGKAGMNKQYETADNVENLIRNGVLKKNYEKWY